MTNLNDTIADLDTLAEAYKRRAGYGKPEGERTADEVYNGTQFAAFANAADMLRRAIKQASDRQLAADLGAALVAA